MRIDDDDFLAHVAAHAGGLGADATWRATYAVLSTIGAHLKPASRELLADELGSALGPAVIRGDASTAVPIEHHVMEPWMTVGRATELIASVCRVLAERLSEELLSILRWELPPTLSARLVRPAPERPRDAAFRRRTTLAEGKPGSSRAIATAAPEPRTETLAEGQPGSMRPLATYHQH
jgi:uncharacterized protein (DUF2267 family)